MGKSENAYSFSCQSGFRCLSEVCFESVHVQSLVNVAEPHQDLCSPVDLNMSPSSVPPTLCFGFLVYKTQIILSSQHWCAENSEKQRIFNKTKELEGFPGGSDSKESSCNVGDLGLILGRSLGGGHGNPLQYSCLEKPHGQRSLAG